MRPAVRVHPVTGPPGAGKTTALVRLDAECPQLTRFGVRDYGLELAEAGDELGLRMRETLLRGELLPDALVRREFTHFLERLPSGVRAVAVEGYPRDLRQCADLVGAVEDWGGQVAELVVLDVPDEVVWTRVARRRICTNCGLPAPDEGARQECAECGGAVSRRGDDKDDRLRQRLREYRGLSAQVRSYFADRHAIRVLDGLCSPGDVRRGLRSVLLP